MKDDTVDYFARDSRSRWRHLSECDNAFNIIRVVVDEMSEIAVWRYYRWYLIVQRHRVNTISFTRIGCSTLHSVKLLHMAVYTDHCFGVGEPRCRCWTWFVQERELVFPLIMYDTTVQELPYQSITGSWSLCCWRHRTEVSLCVHFRIVWTFLIHHSVLILSRFSFVHNHSTSTLPFARGWPIL